MASTMLSAAPAALIALSFLSPAAQDAKKPDAAQLAAEAKSFLPSYDGQPRLVLRPEERREVTASARLYEASLALEPKSAYSLWWLGHAEALLSLDSASRRDEDEAAKHADAALHAFDQTIDVDPTYYWAWYARAMLRRERRQPWDALDDFDQAIAAANAAIDKAGGADAESAVDPRFVRFRARQWRADTRCTTLEFDTARDEYRSFYADNGNNRWDLAYSLADTLLRQHDLVGARAIYEDLLQIEEMRSWDATYAQLGYIAGLLGDRGTAAKRLEEAIAREAKPTLYPRMWLWILAPDERRDQAEADLGDFLAHPPADLSKWDAELGAFVQGKQEEKEFLDAAKVEEDRRLASGEPLDDLRCEAWYYAGLRQEEDAAKAENPQLAHALRGRAVFSYRKALLEEPRLFKWEWEYARLRFAALTKELDFQLRAGFTLDGDQITFGDDDPLNLTRGMEMAKVEKILLHHAGAERPVEGIEAVDAEELRPGDLVLATVHTMDEKETRASVRLVVDAE